MSFILEGEILDLRPSFLIILVLMVCRGDLDHTSIRYATQSLIVKEIAVWCVVYKSRSTKEWFLAKALEILGAVDHWGSGENNSSCGFLGDPSTKPHIGFALFYFLLTR